MKYNLYDATTGLFTGVSISGPAHLAEKNCPDGHRWVIAERVDHLAQKVDLQTGQVVDYQPPAPPDETHRTWAWDASAKRWVPSPTLAALKAARIAEVQAAIETQEKAQDRPQRELMAAFRLSLPAPTVALTRMTAIDNEITRLRALRTSCAAASTKAQLAAIAKP